MDVRYSNQCETQPKPLPRPTSSDAANRGDPPFFQLLLHQPLKPFDKKNVIYISWCWRSYFSEHNDDDDPASTLSSIASATVCLKKRENVTSYPVGVTERTNTIQLELLGEVWCRFTVATDCFFFCFLFLSCGRGECVSRLHSLCKLAAVFCRGWLCDSFCLQSRRDAHSCNEYVRHVVLRFCSSALKVKDEMLI